MTGAGSKSQRHHGPIDKVEESQVRRLPESQRVMVSGRKCTQGTFVWGCSFFFVSGAGCAVCPLGGSGLLLGFARPFSGGVFRPTSFSLCSCVGKCSTRARWFGARSD